MRLNTYRAEQERQASAVKAATEKDEARKEATRIKRVAAKERKKVELAAGRAAVLALAEFEAVANAAAAIKRRSRRRHSRESSHDADEECVSLRPAHATADCVSGLSCREHGRGRDAE